MEINLVHTHKFMKFGGLEERLAAKYIYICRTGWREYKNCIAWIYSPYFLKIPKRNVANHLIFQPASPVFPCYGVCLPFQQVCGKSSWKVMEHDFFGRSSRTFPGSNGTSEKVVLFFRTEYSKWKFVFHFLKDIFDNSFRCFRSFSGKWNCGKRDWIFLTICLNRGPTGFVRVNGKNR